MTSWSEVVDLFLEAPDGRCPRTRAVPAALIFDSYESAEAHDLGVAVPRHGRRVVPALVAAAQDGARAGGARRRRSPCRSNRIRQFGKVAGGEVSLPHRRQKSPRGCARWLTHHTPRRLRRSPRPHVCCTAPPLVFAGIFPTDTDRRRSARAARTFGATMRRWPARPRTARPPWVQVSIAQWFDVAQHVHVLIPSPRHAAYDLDLITTAPSVVYNVRRHGGTMARPPQSAGDVPVCPSRRRGRRPAGRRAADALGRSHWRRNRRLVGAVHRYDVLGERRTRSRHAARR